MSKTRHDAARHLAVSTLSSSDVAESHDIHASESLSTKATRSGETRWRSQHAESRWFRQHATELADAKHCSDNEALGDKLLDHQQQRLNDEEESALAIAAQVSKGLEPDTEPTISLVLPYVDAILYDMKPTRAVSMAAAAGHAINRKPEDLLPASKRAREATYLDFKQRWVDDIDEEYLATLLVATFCDPRHKAFKLRSYSRGDLAAFKRKALEYSKGLYEMDYYRPPPSPEQPAAGSEICDDTPTTGPGTAGLASHMKKSIAINAASFLGREHECNSDSEEDEDEDEWDKYVRLPQISINEDVLTWWKEHESEFPHVAKMAQQVLGCPACSSGVERLFSKAGRNHSKLQGSLKGSSMRDIMFAYNVSRLLNTCLLYTSDAADEEDSVDLGGRRIIKKKNHV
eukprot:TRINITY_DN2148_c0_g1_i2.p1 TRINITY_DN2148_c0_g1~~TRINITY_DN2148_c0_g1_i2.p1  ORF type:complete len:402 (+),score=71.80 TRINITY_DN2148_c0_g1_i2:151-1356(+)